jgi:hypothetical protein
MQIKACWKPSAEIQQKAYLFIPGKVYLMPGELEQSWAEFRRAWNDLAEDQYVQKPYCYRRRRYGRVLFDRESGRLTPRPHTTFVQSKMMNPLYGGVQREFEAIRDEGIRNPCLCRLISSDLERLVSFSESNSNWLVGIHQIRIEGLCGKLVAPAPEGVHRDGSHFIGMHLIHRTNIRGGISTIHSDDGAVLATIELRDTLDTILLDDMQVMHSVGVVEPLDNTQKAIRDMLILTYDPEDI